MRRAALVLALLATSCHHPSSSSREAPDAAPSARPKIVHPRVPLATGEMPLDTAASKLHLTTIKDHVTPVTATMTMRDGAVALDGPSPHARLSVDLDSFDSTIPIRNERVRNIFFETSAIGWDTAELTFDLPKELVDRLREDRKLTQAKLEGRLKVHGNWSKLPVTIDAGWDGPKLWVKSAGPVDVKVSDVGLTDNLHRLNVICMHDSIDDVVKVDVSLVFNPASH